jgi:flagellar hook-basal body complex protein FliE
MNAMPVQGAGLAAYRAAAAGTPGAGTVGAGFEAALGDALHGAVQSGHAADAATTQALAGQGGVTEVVMAVQRAELALQTAVALRDRVVSAYQDVMRMGI